MTMIIIHPSGTIFEESDRGEPPTLSQLQMLVDGYIEIVEIPPDGQLIVDEEGLLKNLPPNPIASGLAGRMIVGIAVVLTEGDKIQ